MMVRIGRVLFFAGLAVWVGGILVLGAVVAPALFRKASSSEAGDLFGFILQRFVYLEFACGALALLGACLTFAGTAKGGWTSWARIVLVTMMILISIGAAFGVNPKIRRLRQVEGEEARQEFSKHHRTSERMALFKLIVGLGLLGFSAWSHPRD